jgi:arylsulfatase A-like enzyme
MDLAPTFLEAAGIRPPECMTAHSLLGVLVSPRSGQVDPRRTFVVTGRERHVAAARDGNLPYPQRALRTRDFLYIRNFAPDRWPMGDPRGLDDPTATPPSFDVLCQDTFIAYADMDASPTKAWMIYHRAEERVRRLFEMGFGRYPPEELYDLRTDPHYMKNVVSDPGYAKVREQMAEQLFAVLRKQKDPRIVEPDCRFERLPFTAGP